MGYWNVSKLVEYLIQVEPSLTSEDFSALKSSEIFMRESNEEENTRHRADELYPPLGIFRKLRLPIIEWSGTSGRWDTSSEGKVTAIYIPAI